MSCAGAYRIASSDATTLHGRSAWDCTLASLAYGMRMDIPGAWPDLDAWAARHGVEGSKSYQTLGASAVVLRHGTARERADKIAEHGLFFKKGLWTARHPTRARSDHLISR